MNNERRSRTGQLARLGAGALVLLATFAFAAEPLVWRADRNEVDANITSWPLPKVLEAIGTATGWRVYLEPETELVVSTRFEKLPSAEALSRLLGGLNYALLSGTNAPAKLFVYRTALDKATRFILPPGRGAPAARIIGNELVVTLKPGGKETIEELARRLGARIVGRLDSRNRYRLQFASEEAAQQARAQLADSESVASTDANYSVPLPSRIESAGGNGPPSSPALKPGTLTGGDYVAVALIDTAVQRDSSTVKDFLLPNVSLAGDTAARSDTLTHGTAMAETILQTAASNVQAANGTPVRILPMDVYGSQPTTSTFEVAMALQALLAANDPRVKIVNLSLGSYADAPYVGDAIRALTQRGVLVVGAAGNDPVSTPVYPAAYPDVLAVTAGDRQGNIAPYANHGTFVDVVMPGTSFVNYEGQSYVVTGTSPAAATASGLVAAAVAATGASPQAAAQQLRQQDPPAPQGR